MKMYRPRAAIRGSLPSLIVYFIIWKKIIAVIDATFAVAKRRPEKMYACTGFEPLTSAILVQRSSNQLSLQANWEQVAELVHYNPVKGWWWSYEYMKIIYESCRVKNYLKEDHRSYRRNFCSWEKKVRLFK